MQYTVATVENLPLTGPVHASSVSVQLVMPRSSSWRRPPSGASASPSREVSLTLWRSAWCEEVQWVGCVRCFQGAVRHSALLPHTRTGGGCRAPVPTFATAPSAAHDLSLAPLTEMALLQPRTRPATGTLTRQHSARPEQEAAQGS